MHLSPPYSPMEAVSVSAVPTGDGWQYEPKWDGFCCLAFRDGNKVELQSKSRRILTAYFPEVVSALLKLSPPTFVLDGEIVIPVNGELSFDHLLMRLSRAQVLRGKANEKLVPGVDTADGIIKDLGRKCKESVVGLVSESEACVSSSGEDRAEEEGQQDGSMHLVLLAKV